MLPGLLQVFPGSQLLIPGTNLGVGWYGIGYVVGIAVMMWVSGVEAERRGIDRKHVTGALIVVAICALVGARAYHVIDQWSFYSQDPLKIVLPPYSGLGLYGGIFGAIVGIAIYTRGQGIPLWRALDVVIPGTLFAQGIARWGNFFNQELYGPPTDLPWAITIDCQHRVAEYSCDQYPQDTTGFHPMFLYESVLDIAGGLIALWLGRRFADRLRDGDIASFWGIWYGSVRVTLETLRAGYNWTIFGFPTATLIGLALIGIGAFTIALRHRRPPPQTATPDSGPAADDDAAAADELSEADQLA